MNAQKSLSKNLFIIVNCIFSSISVAQSFAADCNPMLTQQVEQMMCYPHLDGLPKILDLVIASLRNEAIKIIRNPKKITNASTRATAEKWICDQVIPYITSSIYDQLDKNPLNVASVQEYYGALIYAMALTSKALTTKFEAAALQPLGKDIAKKAIFDIIVTAKEIVAKKTPETIEADKKSLTNGMPAQIIALTQSIDLQQYLVLNVLLDMVQTQQSDLAQAIRDYGISSINKICRKAEHWYKRIKSSSPLDWALAVTGAGAATLFATKFGLPLAQNLFGLHNDSERQNTLIGIAVGQIIHNLGVSGAQAMWTPASKMLNSSILKAYRLWAWLKGEELREMLDGFEVLREEDCDGKEQPPIGIEHVLETILSNVEGALTRLEQGDPAPFQDIQKAFILTGRSGAGKTFAVQQLKIKFAKLNRKLQRKIVYQALTPLHLKSGVLPALIDLAKQREVALILWIDELHLTEPVKDGDTLTLYDFLSAEVINRQNLPVWIIGASNEPGRFDNALVRAGRFEIINIPDFTLENRMQFFAFYAQQEGLVISEQTLRLISFLTQGCPPSLLMKIILSAKQHGEVLTEEWMLDAILRFVVRVTPGFEALSLTAQKELATYILGQAIVKLAIHQKLSDTSPLDPESVLLVTAQAIQPPIKELSRINISTNNVVTNANIEAPRIFGKVVVYEQREGLPFNATTLGKQEELKMLLAGSCAQQEFLGYTNLEYQKEDILRAQRGCLELALNGLSMDALSYARQNEVKEIAEQHLNKLQLEVTEIIKTHREALKLATEILLMNPKSPYLFGSEIRRIMQDPEGMRAELHKAYQQAQSQNSTLTTIPSQQSPITSVANNEIAIN